MNYSYFEECGKVRFPEFNGERHYMIPFLQKDGLPEHLRHWQPTVDAMLETIQTDKEIYLMVDQGQVKANTSHRRGGVHVDNIWYAGAGHGVGGHGAPLPSGHGRGHGSDLHLPSWLRRKPVQRDPVVKRKKRLADADQLIVLASDLTACAAYEGEWDDIVTDKGDCSHIDLSNLCAKELLAGTVYKGDTTQMLHESLPIPFNCNRTVVRLNVNM